MSFPDDVVFTEAAVSYDMESDISQMEAPTFTTIDRGAPQAMLDLAWDHKLNLVGKKVVNPMIHCCDKCKRPILIYGRMIPCKHVFCLACGKMEDKACPRCGDKVSRVEQGGLGNIFLCTEGGSRYGNTGCRRTYLSSRDLQAHIAHRHSAKGNGQKQTLQEKTEAAVAPSIRREETGSGEVLRNNASHISTSSLAAAVAAVNSANLSAPSVGSAPYSGGSAVSSSHNTASYNTPPPGGHGSHISVLTTRQSNLISVPIQGGEAAHSGNTDPRGGTGSPAGGYSQGAGYPGSGYPAYTTTAQPGTQAYSQPPPAYQHQYGAGYNSAAGQQYSSGGGGGASTQQYSGVGAPGGVSSHVAPAQTGYTAPSAQQQQYQAQWTRPPPPGPPASGYYRR